MVGATIWKGIIHFEDTDIPVKLHAAVKEERIQFHLLHRKDLVRVRQQMVCALDKQPVPTEEQAKGYEVEEGKYVILEPKELELMVPENDRKITVHAFVRNSQIDPLFLDRVYYLESDALDAGYVPFAGALAKLDAAGICSWTMRKRSYYGALQAAGKGLRLTVLHYADEVVLASTLGLQNTALTDREIQIGSELIGKMSAVFDPFKFGNEHQNKLRDMIERKAKGENIAVVSPRRLNPTEPDNLLQALEASLKKAA